MRHTGRALAAVALLAAGIALPLALVPLLGLGVVGLIRNGFDAVALARLLVLGALLVPVVTLAWTLRSRRRATGPEGLALPQAEQPRLWAEVFALADRVESPPPDEIRLVPRVALQLVEERPALGLRPGVRRLYLGVPLMLGLSAEQLTAVLAHELGHHSARQPALDLIAHRGKEAITRLLADAGPGTWTGRLVATYAWAYDVVAYPVAREVELEADLIAAELAGSRTTIAALEEIGALAEAWQEFLGEYVDPGRQCGLRPDGLLSGFADFLDDAERQRWMEGHEERRPPERRPLHDPHPPLPERLAALRGLSTGRQLDFSGAAEDILDRRDVTFRALEDLLAEGSDLRVAPWEEVATAGAAGRAAHNATRLLEAAEAHGAWPADAQTLLQILQAGRAAPLMRALAPEATGEHLDRLAGRMIGDTVAQRLVEAGRARFQLSWSHAPLLVARNGAPLDPWSMAAEATRSAAGLADFEAWLREQGVRLGSRPAPAPAPVTVNLAVPPAPPVAAPPEAPLAPAAAAVGSAQPALAQPAPADDQGVLAAAAPVAGSAWGTLLVSSAGILLRKVDLVEKAALTRASARAAQGAALLGRTVTRPVHELASHRRTESLAWADITRAEFSGLEEDKGVLTLHVATGKPRRVEFLPDTEIHGDLLGALEDLLGPRLSLG